MMWVIRAGQNSVHYEKFIKESKVYLAWDGYRFDLSSFKTLADLRNVVEKEKMTENRTSISNWAGQLYAFVWEIKIGDYILIPAKYSRLYCLAKISGHYHFDKSERDSLYHSRNIKLLEVNIPREIFSQSLIYSLGAFRTIFKVKQEDEIVDMIEKRKEVASI